MSSPFYVQGQNSATPDTLEGELSDILIEATRLTETEGSAPFSISLKQRDIADTRFEPALSLDRVLSDIPGLWVSNRENFALGERISIRGMGWRAAFGVRGIYVMLDGIPLTMPDGQTGLDILDPAFIKQVEVIRGPSSSFWGNAGGGAIFLSTRDVSDQPTARIRAYTGSYGTYKVEGATSTKVGDHHYNLFGSYLEHEGFRDHSSHRSYRFGGHAGFDLSANTDLTLSGAFVDAPFTQHPGALNEDDAENNPRMATPAFVQADAGKAWRQGQAGATLTHRTDMGNITATTYGIIRYLHNPLTFADIEVNRSVGGGRVSMQDNTIFLSWGIGIDASQQQDDRKNYDYENNFTRNNLILNQTETVSNTGIFSRIGTTWERFNVSASLRYDYLFFENNDHLLIDGEDHSGNRSFSSISPSMGISYRILTNLLYANFGTAFESPTTTELVNRPDMTGGFNPNLNPEKTLGVEGGMRGILNNWNISYDMAIYHMKITDRLISFRTEDGGDRDFYRNEGLTYNTGFESHISWQVSQIEAQTGYTWSRFIFSQDNINNELDGNRLPGIPEHRLIASLQYTPSVFWMSIQGEKVGEYFANDQNTITNSGYFIFDLQLGHLNLALTTDLSIQPFLKINNVSDVRYNTSVSINAFGGRYFEPAPGRVFQAGFTIEI
ncbi:MAG: TonB-dependent receptor [Balneolales bacterium]